ncbi:hypothetical protein ACJJTC_007414 [Scirpophaga incertulas]
MFRLGDYVPSANNVADTRPDAKFQVNSRWFIGPSFLFSSKETWPTEPPSQCQTQSFSDECKKHSVKHWETIGLTSTSPHELPSPVVTDHTRFSVWIRLVRATAHLYSCFDKFRSILFKIRSQPSSHSPSRHTMYIMQTSMSERLLSLPQLTADNIIFAEKQLLIQAQYESFNIEIRSIRNSEPINKKSCLAKISIYLDAEQILRVSGRTGAVCKNLPLLLHGPNPMVLDGNHLIVQLLIRHYHCKFMHGYNEAVVNELQQCYHILRLRPTVKMIASNCLSCRKRKTVPYAPPIGDLPEDRLTPSRPFSRVGLDYFGPINLQPLQDSDLLGRRDWKKGLRLADHFWQRWTREYLPIIRTRRATSSSNQPACGDVVVVVDGNLPRSCWPIGKITKVWPGKDGKVRVAEVATKGGVLKRAAKMLAPLLCQP